MEWKLKKFEDLSTHELYSLLQVRVAVFVVEQMCPYPEVDGHDLASYHLYGTQNGEIIAYCRILPRGTVYQEASIGRVLVNQKFRGQGLAGQLMTRTLRFMEEELLEKTIKIQAQDYLREFYSSFGFQPISEVYLEDNIPHVDMILHR